MNITNKLLFVTVFLISSIIQGYGQPISFISSKQYYSDYFPMNLISADLNKDGNTDIIVVNNGDTQGTFSVFLGNPAGSFTRTAVYDAGERSFDLTKADFNSDGNIDIAVSNDGGTQSIYIYLGNGDGTFKSPKITPVTLISTQNSIKAGDFNNDNKSDLAVANIATNNISVYLGTDSGTFIPSVEYPVGSSPSDLLTVDLNSDSILDIVTTNSGSNNLSILIGNINGTFNSASNYILGNSPLGITGSDLNKDGNIDLIITHPNSNNMSVILGNGNGTLGTSTIFPVGGLYPIRTTTSDFNQDSNVDIAVANRNSDNISIFFGSGNGSFSFQKSIYGGKSTSSILAAYLNNDSNSDLVSTSIGSNNISISLASTPGNFIASNSYNIPFPGYDIFSSDLNNDNWLDLTYCGGALATLNGAGGGDFNPAVIKVPNNWGYGYMKPADLNDDGIIDIVASSSSSNGFCVILGSTGGNFSNLSCDYITNGNNVNSIALEDFNGDGKIDIATANNTPDVSIMINNGSGNFSQGIVYNIGSIPREIAVADINKDGNKDIVVSNNNGFLCLMLGDGDGGFTVNKNLSLSYFYDVIAVADFNHDHNLDLVSIDQNGYVSILLGNGSGNFTFKNSYSIGGNLMNIITEDFNGDGNVDLCVSQTIYPGKLYFLSGNGDGSFTMGPAYEAGSHLQKVIAGDFNNDKKMDVAVPVSITQTIAVLINNSSTTYHSPLIYFESGNTRICSGIIASFSVKASGSSLSYQWQVNLGSGYVDLINNNTYSNVNSDKLIVNSNYAMDGYQFRCIVSGTFAPSDTSGTQTLFIKPTAAIIFQPSDIYVTSPQNVTFNISSSGGSGLNYQWYENKGSGFLPLPEFGIYTGTATNTLNISQSSPAMNGYRYYCLISGCGFMTSDTATLHINSVLSTGNQHSNFNINAYPNPVNDVLYLDFSDKQIESIISIHNTLGEKLIEQVVEASLSLHAINIKTLSKGIYFLTISNNSNLAVLKIIKE
jgi:hypothetical protein